MLELTDEELGELFRAMIKYARNKEEFEFEHRSLKLVFGFIKSALDRDRQAYEERCKKNAENAAKAAKSREKKGAEMDYDTLMGSLVSNL